MVAIKTLFLFAIPALSAVILERQQSTISADLRTVDSDVKSLDSAILSFDGSFGKAVAVQNAANQLDNDIKSSTTRVNNSPALSSSDSATDVAFLNNPLETDVSKTINDLIAKKSQVASSGYQGLVCDELKTLLSDGGDYATALVNKFSSDQKTNANSVKTKILADLQKGINAYC